MRPRTSAGHPRSPFGSTTRRPGAVPVAIDGGDVWRNRNDFDIAWANPDEGDRAPITASRYRLCPVGRADCITDRRPGEVDHLANLSVPSAGEWHLSIWREDAAGNQQPANASVPVTLRYDPEPPDLGFEEPSAADPTLISALVTDKVSGLAGGEIELSAQGSGVWETLPTRQEGSRLRARIDDARYPPGTYVLRATARDRATNQNSTESRLDGRPMTLTLPLRARTSVRAGVRRTVRRHGRRPRRRAVLDRKARVSFGHRVRVAGDVRTPDGTAARRRHRSGARTNGDLTRTGPRGTSDRSARTLRVSDQGDCDHDLARRLSGLRLRPFRRSAR